MRKQFYIRNMFAGVLNNVVTQIVSFVVRTVFINTLSSAYLGINGLFSSILTVLSLSELGIGTAIVYALYKPVAKGDVDKIKSLMCFYRKAYRIIGFAFLVLGLAALPFLEYLINGTTDLVNIRFIFILFILNSVSSYWFFAYKGAILTAHQKGYVVSIISNISLVAISVIKVIALLLLKDHPAISFYVYTIIGISGNITTNLLTKNKVDKMFPYLRENNAEPLTKENKVAIKKNVVGLIFARVSGVFINATDNILISMFINISAVGIYSNYILLKGTIISALNIIFGSLGASIGNLCATETKEKQVFFFKVLQFAYFWLYGFCSICIMTLFTPFIGGVWLSSDYLLPEIVLFLFTLNFLLDGLSGAVIKYRDANGLYWKTKFRYLCSAVINAIVSYIAIGPLNMGIQGCLMGTTASILILLLFDPIIVYKNVFKENVLKYYLSFFGYLLLIICTGGVVYCVANLFSDFTILNFVIRLLICICIPNVLWIIIFHKKAQYIYLLNTINSFLQKIKSRRPEHGHT